MVWCVHVNTTTWAINKLRWLLVFLFWWTRWEFWFINRWTALPTLRRQLSTCLSMGCRFCLKNKKKVIKIGVKWVMKIIRCIMHHIFHPIYYLHLSFETAARSRVNSVECEAIYLHLQCIYSMQWEQKLILFSIVWSDCVHPWRKYDRKTFSVLVNPPFCENEKGTYLPEGTLVCDVYPSNCSVHKRMQYFTG